MTDSAPQDAARPPRKPLKTALRLVILAVVAWGIWHTVNKAKAEFSAHRFHIADLDPRWVAISGVLYVLGILPCAIFWHQTLRAMGQQPGFWRTLRAYFIGNLGKYVPGKAMVVVLRTGFVRGSGVDTTVAATSVFVETLTMMAVGASLSAVILAVTRSEPWLLGLSLLLMSAAGIPTVPPLFRRIVRWLQVRRSNPNIDAAIAGLDWRLMGTGWLAVGFGWWFVGLSLWAALRAMPGTNTELLSTWESVALLTACVALAIVAGFVSLLPGGIGVRELVVMTLLAPPFGRVTAIVSAVVLRVVWLVAELLVSIILYVVVRPERSTPPSTPPA